MSDQEANGPRQHTLNERIGNPNNLFNDDLYREDDDEDDNCCICLKPKHANDLILKTMCFRGHTCHFVCWQNLLEVGQITKCPLCNCKINHDGTNEEQEPNDSYSDL